MHTLGLRKGTRRKKIWYLNGTSNFRTLCSFQKAEVRNTLSSVCMCACACACACACVCVCACAYVREFCWCWSVLPSWLFFKLLFSLLLFPCPNSALCVPARHSCARYVSEAVHVSTSYPSPPHTPFFATSSNICYSMYVCRVTHIGQDNRGIQASSTTRK